MIICLDENECMFAKICNTSQYCINTPGNYYCLTCPPGYVQNPYDSTTCEGTLFLYFVETKKNKTKKTQTNSRKLECISAFCFRYFYYFLFNFIIQLLLPSLGLLLDPALEPLALQEFLPIHCGTSVLPTQTIQQLATTRLLQLQLSFQLMLA